MASTKAVKEAMWLQAILGDLGGRQHSSKIQNIQMDNQQAIALAYNLQFHARIKYTGIHYHFVCKEIANKEIWLPYLFNNLNTAQSILYR